MMIKPFGLLFIFLNTILLLHLSSTFIFHGFDHALYEVKSGIGLVLLITTIFTFLEHVKHREQDS
ncbi:hypothetical protein [Bacillus sp. AK128]